MINLPSYHSLQRAARKHNISRFRLTAELLATIVGEGNRTGLHLAAVYKCLDQVVGGVTAEQLYNAMDDSRITALYLAIITRSMDLIRGGVTAEDLASAKERADFSTTFQPVPADGLPDTSEEEVFAHANTTAISALKDVPQMTGLHCVAHHGGLTRVKGGVMRNTQKLPCRRWMIGKRNGGRIPSATRIQSWCP
jgi:hypothetical protein